MSAMRGQETSKSSMIMSISDLLRDGWGCFAAGSERDRVSLDIARWCPAGSERDRASLDTAQWCAAAAAIVKASFMHMLKPFKWRLLLNSIQWHRTILMSAAVSPGLRVTRTALHEPSPLPMPPSAFIESTSVTRRSKYSELSTASVVVSCPSVNTHCAGLPDGRSEGRQNTVATAARASLDSSAGVPVPVLISPWGAAS